MSDFEQIEAAMEGTHARLGVLDTAVGSAGITGPNSTLEDYDVAAWRKVFDVNVHGTFLLNRACVPGMKAKEYGRILNIASVAGKAGNPHSSAYSASKAAVTGMTKSLGKELVGNAIAVNCVTPAAAKTRDFGQMSDEHINYTCCPRSRAGGFTRELNHDRRGG